jgi:predicted Rossmann-fold nucleotide-binding protein
MGSEFWRDLQEQLDAMVDRGMIDRSDLDLVLVTDDVEEAMAHIRRIARERFALRSHLRPIRALGESIEVTR